MKSLNTLSLVLASAALLSSASLVQAEGLTREQVKAELADAKRNGTLIADGETGATYRDMNPDRYPALQATAGKSREQVKVELAEAQRSGTLIADGETGATYRDLAPQNYPAPIAMAGKKREEVKLELATAIRLGDIPIDETGLTPAERFPGTYAAVRAEHELAIKARKANQQTAQGTSTGQAVR